MSDENVLAKKRWTSSEMFLWKNVMKKNLLADNNNPDYKCITRFGVIATDWLETKLLSSDLDHQCRSSLAKSLGSGHYVWVGEQARLGGKTAYSMFVLNISVRAVAYYCRKFQLPAFIYGEFRDGHIHSEYWEKADVTKPLSARVNQYQKKEEMDAMITSAGFDDQSVIGERFEYAVPFSLFPAISEYIHKNISTLDAHSRTGAMNIALYGIGENAWRYRGLVYRGIKPMELIM